MTNKLTEEILDKIKQEKIEPKSKWNFILKDYFIWAMLGLSIIVGSLAVSVIIFMMNSNTEIIGVDYLNWQEKFYIFIPYSWVIVLGIFVYVAYFNLKNTKKGYKINPYLIVVISIVVSIILGSTAYMLGLGRTIETAFYDRVPFYQKMFEHKMKLWHDPVAGRLMGVVVGEIEDDYWVIDVMQQEWLVYSKYDLPVNRRVKLFGEIIEPGKFIVEKLNNCKMPIINNNHCPLNQAFSERKIQPMRINR